MIPRSRSRLHEHLQRPAQMFGMGQCLKLAAALHSREMEINVAASFHNARQKLRLANKRVRGQPGAFAGLLQCRKIDMRGEIVVTWMTKQIAR